MSILFLDTEFTDLLSPQLLSIGMTTNEGEEFYAELDLSSDVGKTRVRTASEFVKYGGVLDQWGRVPGATGTEWEIGRRAGEWLLCLTKSSKLPIEIAFDYSMDFELLEFAVRDAGLWEQVREGILPINIANLTGSLDGEMAAEECYRELSKSGGRGIGRHHALADALALRAAYLAAKQIAIASFTPIGANIPP